jgi:Anti-sigma-K factor rskA, C-terminal/Anti-sigma-K factor RskA, N-terminal domain
VARELTPAELRELLPVYALDAVEHDERVQIDAYLERTPAAQREVDELRETAALLAFSDRDAAPDGLWSRIEDALGAEPPGLVLPLSSSARHGRRGLAGRVAIGIAAASAVAAGITAFIVSDEMSRQEKRLERVAASVAHQGMRRAAEAAVADPRARTVNLRAASGSTRAKVVTMPDGTAFLMATDVPRLAPGRIYQLWAVVGDEPHPPMVSAGLLGRSFDIAAFHAPGDTVGFMVTAEAAPGVDQTHATPVLEGHYS